MIAEMFAYYKTRNISLLDKLNEIYDTYGVCLNTLHSYEFPGSTGMDKMRSIMSKLRSGLDHIGDYKIVKTEDYLNGLNGLPASDVIKYYYSNETASGSVVIRPSGTEPKLKMYISVTAKDREVIGRVEAEIEETIKRLFEKADNTDYDNIFCRVACIDLIYSTQIQRFSRNGIVVVTNHIQRLASSIDKVVKKNEIDYELYKKMVEIVIPQITEVIGEKPDKMTCETKTRILYSFASKFLSIYNARCLSDYG